MDNKKKVKLAISIVFFFIILASITYMIKNKDTIFTSVTKIQYPDRCIEEYKNNVLITPECTKGREIYDKQLKGEKTEQEIPAYPTQWTLNIT